jgi:Fumarylacetoacetate (FAA) hydrolase family
MIGPATKTCSIACREGRYGSMRVAHLTGRERPLAGVDGSRVAAVSYLSRACTLHPGDLILTGTPWGVEGFRTPPVFLEPGDTVEIEVEGIGVLANDVRRSTT